MALSLLLIIPALALAGEPRLGDCAAVEKLYPQLDRSYLRKAPLFAGAGWGRLEDWGSEELAHFRAAVLDCRRRGYLKNLDPVFLEADLEKKMEEIRRESSRLKDDKRILATIRDYEKRVSAIAANLTETGTAELRDIKALLMRTSGLDESRHFNRAGDLQNRIDAILAGRRSAESKPMPPPAGTARKADPRGFKKCAELRSRYDQLVQSSVTVRRQLLAEKEVEPTHALEQKRDDILRKLDSASLQMEQAGCRKFL